MIKYRVRKGLFGKSVLQYLKTYPAIDEFEWIDVSYNESPRALVSEIDVYDKNKNLEIENAELHTEIEILRDQIKKIRGY